ncbi:IS630 family transposase [Streptomyces sp. TRM68367]|uniref:IS630 family transposase n=1 Tax=Streptomyces sp. TRM68367 TaxID=2758415 RepID=UPI0021D215A6|nr:IS630 family transposase [Streptomyces sp. TRM68367]
MNVAAARPIALRAAECERLKKMAYGHKTEYRLRMRAQVVLHAARGRSNARIARETGLHLDTVRCWRGRFAAQGLAGLSDRERSGRPPSYTALEVAEAKALACRLPAETGVPLARWSCPELAAELAARGITGPVSASTVRRWLRDDALKPWQYQSDLHHRPRVPAQGRARAGPVRPHLAGPAPRRRRVRHQRGREDLHPGPLPLPPTLAPGQARAMRVNHTYHRGGALAYLAAYDVHQAKVFGRCEPRTGIDPFMNLVAQVMAQEPYASAKRVFWVVDNGSSHRGKAAADRLAAAFLNAVLVHTPVHASWVNQVEIFFSVVQRKVVSPNDFTDLNEVENRLRAFEDRYSAAAQPFQWKFTTSDLDDLLARLDRHTADHQQESSAAAAA